MSSMSMTTDVCDDDGDDDDHDDDNVNDDIDGNDNEKRMFGRAIVIANARALSHAIARSIAPYAHSIATMDDETSRTNDFETLARFANADDFDVAIVRASDASESLASSESSSSFARACAMSERIRATGRGRKRRGRRVFFAHVVADAFGASAFVDDGGADALGMYASVRATMEKRATTTTTTKARAFDECGDDGLNPGDLRRRRAHEAFLERYEETRALLGGRRTRARTNASATATTRALAANVVGSKISLALQRTSARAKAKVPLDQWTHVDVSGAYAPDRADAHLAPVHGKEEYETLADGGDDDDDDEDDDEKEEEANDDMMSQGKMFGFDALTKLSRFRALVCGADVEANDACVDALARVGVGRIDVFGASGDAERVVGRECEVDYSPRESNDFAARGYDVVARTSAYDEADDVVARARDIGALVIDIYSDNADSCSLSVNAAANSARGAFAGCMDRCAAGIAANLAAMEVIRFAQGRGRTIDISYDGYGAFET